MRIRDHILIGIFIFVSLSSFSSDMSIPKDLEFSFFDDDFDYLSFTLEKKGETILLKSAHDFITEFFPRSPMDLAKPLESKSKTLSNVEFIAIWEKIKTIGPKDYKQYKSLVERSIECGKKGCRVCGWRYLHYSTAGKTVASWKRNICEDFEPPSKFSQLFEVIKTSLYGPNKIELSPPDKPKDYKKN